MADLLEVALVDKGKVVPGGGSGGGASAATVIEFETWQALPESKRTSGEYLIKNTIEADELNALDKVMHVINGAIVSEQYTGKPELVSWSAGTDTQIAAMINGFYKDELTLAEIKSVWSVGDSRTISLSAMNATGVGESHRAQDIEMVILDFEHDDLANAVNGHTKALITVQQKDCLRAANTTDTGGESNTENGYMNSSNTNVGGWTNCARRAWCNNVYFAALPAAFKELVKTVNKVSTVGNQGTGLTTTKDDCWLVSEQEVFGTKAYAAAVEGSQYKYYETASNRYKLPRWNASHVSDNWWERSPSGSYAVAFCSVYVGGSAYVYDASVANGLAPACCL